MRCKDKLCLHDPCVDVIAAIANVVTQHQNVPKTKVAIDEVMVKLGRMITMCDDATTEEHATEEHQLDEMERRCRKQDRAAFEQLTSATGYMLDTVHAFRAVAAGETVSVEAYRACADKLVQHASLDRMIATTDVCMPLRVREWLVLAMGGMDVVPEIFQGWALTLILILTLTAPP